MIGKAYPFISKISTITQCHNIKRLRCCDNFMMTCSGMISVTMTAKGDLKGVNIDKSLIDPEEPEILEDLILAAHNDARRKAEQRQQEILKDAAGGLELPPGMQMPF